MRDDELVLRITRRDPSGLAEAYDRYAAGLFGYCLSKVQPADAADVVQDTFLIAAERAGCLRDASRLRPWLYRVARNECLRQLRIRNREIPAERVPEVAGTEAVTAVIERDELGALVRDAAEGVDAAKREVLNLQLQGLDAEESAMVLGVPLNHLHARLSRAREQFRVSVGVLLVARAGRGDCAELGRVLTGWDGRLTPGLRRQLVRHVDRCPACHVTRHRALTPSILAGVAAPLAVAVLPAGLRDRVLHSAASADPAAQLHRAVVARHAGPFGRHGFPARARPGAPKPWHHVRPVHAVATVAMGAGTVAAAVALGPVHIDPWTPAVTGAGPGTRPAVTATRTGHGGGPGTTAPAGTGGATAAVAVASPAVSTRAAPSNPAVVPSSPGPSASPSGPLVSAGVSLSQVPVVVQGTLTITPSSLTLLPLVGSAFTITADGGPVSWSVAEPVSILGSVEVSPSSGTLQAGQSVTVTVTLSSVLSVASDLTVSPGGGVVTILAGAGVLGAL